MPFLLAEILNFQGSTHRIGVGSFSNYYKEAVRIKRIFLLIKRIISTKINCATASNCFALY